MNNYILSHIKKLYTPIRVGNGFISTIENAAVVIENGLISWVGQTEEIPNKYHHFSAQNCSDFILTPGLIDAHTHLVFAGERAIEFGERLKGATYQEIASKGGGIATTVRQTRLATEQELLRLTRPRLQRWIEQGITTVEIKSGYGLTTESEIKCLKVIQKLKSENKIDIASTFLGAHDIPPEFKNRKEEYISIIMDEMLPEIAKQKLAEAVDVFCETGVYTVEESRRILNRAKELGFTVKVHADELSPLGGASLAAELNALSADHLLCIPEKGISDLAASQTVAMLLPGTAWFLKMDYAPARKMIEKNINVSVASDFNPGSCTIDQFSQLFLLSTLYMGLTPNELLSAVTINAAKALNRENLTGRIAPGFRADLVLWNAPSWEHLIYHSSSPHAAQVYAGGNLVYQSNKVIERRYL